MNTNIFIPSKINVGFQNRKDTYTGKLAYVIYFDEKGKLRKETSWNNWRDNEIPNEIYDNEPTEGFVLNKKVGGVEESWGWNPRQTYTRVYDPRGFEFEISIPNLLWILENCNCIKGKGLEGEFVYGWDGKELVLVPVDSPDYKIIQEKNKIIHNNEFIKAKDLIIGATYGTLGGEQFVYMGKYNVYDVNYNELYIKNYWDNNKEWRHPLDDTWIDDTIFGFKDRRYQTYNSGKEFWFIKLGNPNAIYSWEQKDHFVHYKTINKKFGTVITTVCEKYPEYYAMMQKTKEFSPIDYNKNKILPVAYEDFEKALIEHMNKTERYHSQFIFTYMKDGRLNEQTISYNYGNSKWCYYESVLIKGVHPWQNRHETKTVYIDINSIKDIYNKFKPMYGEQYLENGNLYRRRGYYGSEE